MSPGSALLDTYLQAVELLRDPSHVCDYALDEWFAALARAGFRVNSCKTWRPRMDFVVWTERMRTPAPLVEAIRLLQARADARTCSFFGIEAEGSFWLDAAMIEAFSV